MNTYFPEVKKNFGFGCMRLPMKNNEVDYEEFTKMVDTFIENGFNYFDTAHGYVGGKSEIALCDCLTGRYPREAYILTNKRKFSMILTAAVPQAMPFDMLRASTGCLWCCPVWGICR